MITPSAIHSGVGILTISLALLGSAHAADPLQSAIEVQSEAAQEAAESQQRIDQAFEARRHLLEEYKLTVREFESLRRYDEHLEKMVIAQGQSITSLQKQLGEIEITHREILPLMSRMVDTLAQFVELDVPFLLVERQQRVQRLKDLIDNPQVSLSEKYRQIMEAYQVEIEYGRTVEAYRGMLQGVGQERTVDFLRVGRVALIYRSLDGTQAGVWDPRTRAWKPLSDTYRRSLDQGFRVARKQAAPNLLKLPVSAPETLP